MTNRHVDVGSRDVSKHTKERRVFHEHRFGGRVLGLGNGKQRDEAASPIVFELHLVMTDGVQQSFHPEVVGEQLEVEPANVALPRRTEEPLEQNRAETFALVRIDNRNRGLGGFSGVREPHETSRTDAFVDRARPSAKRTDGKVVDSVDLGEVLELVIGELGFLSHATLVPRLRRHLSKTLLHRSLVGRSDQAKPNLGPAREL